MSQSWCDKIADDDYDVDKARKQEMLVASVPDSSCTESEVKLSKAAEHEVSGESSDDSVVDQWRRSIVVSAVPEEILSNVLMTLEVKKRGGGKVESHLRDRESGKVLITFSESAGEFSVVC